jgi:hypothetical protein
MELGYVYLIVEADHNGYEKYKIGITKNNPENRLKKLKTGNSNEMFIVRTYQSENYRRIEKMLHRKYSAQRTISKNEFFHLTDSQIFSFSEDCKKMDDIIKLMKKENYFYK